MKKWLKFVFSGLIFCFSAVTVAQTQPALKYEQTDLCLKMAHISMEPFFTLSLLSDYNFESNFFQGIRGKRTVVHVVTIIARPDLKVWPTGKKFFYVLTQTEYRVNQNMWVDLFTQFSSPYEQHDDFWNWEFGLGPKIRSNSKSRSISVYFLIGSEWGKLNKRIVFNWQKNF